MSKLRRFILISALLALILSLGVALTAPVMAQHEHYEHYNIMHPDKETFDEWVRAYWSAPIAHLTGEEHHSSYSVLNLLQYTPAERDQDRNGNCWVWAGTGVLEIALDVQKGIRDRLSIQYFNSNYQAGTGPQWAGCGGWLSSFASFYNVAREAIPWSNTNAGWRDSNQGCAAYQTTVPANTISTVPNYPITRVQDERIPTIGVGQATAIANIKDILHQNRGVWFAYFLPTTMDWDNFGWGWWNLPESLKWNPPASGGTADAGVAGHAVLVVGYNDDEGTVNDYWIALNSWGTANGLRPNGLFRFAMDINYDSTFYWYNPESGQYDQVPSYLWETLGVDGLYLTISSTAGGYVNTPGQGSFACTAGEVVELVATPDVGYRFVNWTGNVGTIANANAASTTITMNGDCSITANFVPVYDLTISSTEGGSVTTPGEGTFTYDGGTVVNLAAEADARYKFVKWTGDVDTIADVEDATTTITMNDNYSITANFTKGGCFIATTVYGTPMAQEIQILREFRDKYLLTNSVGRAFVDFYYRASPPIAEFITEHPSLKPIVRAVLVPAVAMSYVAVNTTPAKKIATVGLLVLVSMALAVWAKRRPGRGPQHT